MRQPPPEHRDTSHPGQPASVDAAPASSVPVFRIATMDCAAEEGEIRHAPGPFGQLLTAGLPRYALALLLAFGAESLSFFAPATPAYTLSGMVLAAAAIALSGFSTYTKGLTALRHGRLSINALMTVAVTGAFLIGQWPEAAMVMALYAIAELIEARSVDRARKAIKSLLDMTPETAELGQPDGSWVVTPVETVSVDAIVRVKPGARVPLDGVIVSGVTSVDQSPVIGESMPVDKAMGDAVFAGTINTTGLFEARVTAPASATLLARIIHAVEQAQGARASVPLMRC